MLRALSESGVTINVVNPGLCKTELSRNVGSVTGMIIGIWGFLARTAEAGSRNALHSAVEGKESDASSCEIKE